jgi:pullulanase/glycogen debranching enzyme
VTGWVDWSALDCTDRAADNLMPLVARLTALRREFPQLRTQTWTKPWPRAAVLDDPGEGACNVLWLTPQGKPMTEADWDFQGAQFLSYVLAASDGNAAPLYVVLNAAAEAIDIVLPVIAKASYWRLRLNTCEDARASPHPAAMANQWDAEQTIPDSLSRGTEPIDGGIRTGQAWPGGACMRAPARSVIAFAGEA